MGWTGPWANSGRPIKHSNIETIVTHHDAEFLHSHISNCFYDSEAELSHILLTENENESSKTVTTLHEC